MRKGVGNRFKKHPNGAVPSHGRTPEEQLKYLDQHKFVAAKERVKIQKRLSKMPPQEEKK